MKKLLIGLGGLVGIVLAVAIGYQLGVSQIRPLGATSYDANNFNGTLTANGTATFNKAATFNGSATMSSVTAKSLTSVNGTATSTLTAGSSAIGTNVGKLCLWNGTQYTLVDFAAGTTTPTYATSTSCN